MRRVSCLLAIVVVEPMYERNYTSALVHFLAVADCRPEASVPREDSCVVERTASHSPRPPRPITAPEKLQTCFLIRTGVRMPAEEPLTWPRLRRAAGSRRLGAGANLRSAELPPGGDVEGSEETASGRGFLRVWHLRFPVTGPLGVATALTTSRRPRARDHSRPPLSSPRPCRSIKGLTGLGLNQARDGGV